MHHTPSRIQHPPPNRPSLVVRRKRKQRVVLIELENCVIKRIFILIAGIILSDAAMGETTMVASRIDWPKFMARHDLIWKRMPKQWYEAPFLGNGMMGTMIRQTGNRAVRFDVGRGDVQNHRPSEGLYGVGRLPIGHFDLETVGTITGGEMRLDLWNAEASGTIRTDRGSVDWRSFVHADIMVIVTIIKPSKGEQNCRLEWRPEKAINPRYTTRKQKPDGYKFNPPFTQEKEGDVNVSVQPLIEGGETVTAWQILKKDHERHLLVSVAHSYPETTARKEAVGVLESVNAMSMKKLVEGHRTWWHEWYQQSFISIPDTWWESFYWIQMYKLASGTRSDRMLLDLQGPWPQPTPWPGCWWNLNVQLTYWATYASNRLKVGNSLCRTMYENMDNLINSVPEKYRSDSAGVTRATGQHCSGGVIREPGDDRPAEVGDLIWACHNCWLHYRYSMDDAVLRNNLLPLLKRAVNYHLHFLKKGDDGKLHLPKTLSPEYNYASGPDCNYDLALLRWGCTTLLDACERLDIEDPLIPRWKDVLENLADYPTDENGYMIAAGVPFAKPHRHYSHLLMLYPLYLVNREQDGARELAMKSVNHWQDLTPRGTGYTKTGASSIFSAFGMGNRALEKLNEIKSYIKPNTMYKEAGPVIETPLSAAQSLHDMIIQSWGGTIRVFPAAPDAWGDIVFDDLRTEGAFLVSAARKNGKTQWVRIKSLAGEPCRIMPALDGKVRVSGTREFKIQETSDGCFTLDLAKGEESVLFVGDKAPNLEISPLAAEQSNCNSFGMK